ncbi:hypothetical protein V8G61_14350 [Gaetbulibacter sp. M240]|uniref:hypothetical protein n=1 Tax=Gaetbulibacter sp. M240 TaxID=3126511 RepID=UPI00374E5EC7
MSPEGLTGHQKITGIHCKNLEHLSHWSNRMRQEIPDVEQLALSEIKIIFYNYRFGSQLFIKLDTETTH